MEINVEQLKTFSPEITLMVNNLLTQLNPKARTLTDEDAREIIEESSNRFFIARESTDNKIIAMLTLIVFNAPCQRKGLLEDFIVDENYQGKGIGTKLINFAINQARKEEVAYIDFTSNPKRVVANKFYQHLGFKKRDTNVYRINL